MKEINRTKIECKKKALSYISRYTCSSAKLREYLVRKGCEDHAEEIVQELVRSGLLDDFKNAQLLVEIYRRKYGRKAIFHKLLQKGFSRETVNAVVSLSEDDEYELAVNEARKKAAILKEKDSVRATEKLYRFLIRRGFSSRNAIKAVKEVLKNSEYFNDFGGV